MFGDNETVVRVVRHLVRESCRRLFGAYGVKLLDSADANQTVDEIVWCGVMGFAGSDMRGSLLLAGTKGPFAQSRPAQGEMRDWVGELTNQLVGRLKVQLLERGTAVALSTPVVLQGEHVAPLPRRVLVPVAFTADQGMILVWIDVETKRGFELRLEPDPTLIPADEETALFF